MTAHVLAAAGALVGDLDGVRYVDAAAVAPPEQDAARFMLRLQRRGIGDGRPACRFDNDLTGSRRHRWC